MENNKRGRNDEERLKLFLEYVNETGEKITTKTVYKVLNLGNMLMNTRFKYERQGLDVDEELLQECLNRGIIGRQRAKRTSHDKKYHFVLDMADKEKAHRYYMENGFDYINARNDLQLNYNRGTLNLTPEQIDELKEKGIIRASKEEYQEICEKTGFSERIAFYVIQKYGSLEEFNKQIKLGNIEFDEELAKRIGNIRASYKVTGEEFYDILPDRRPIFLSEKEITRKQKELYARLLMAIFGQMEVEASEIRFFDMDKIEETLKTLTPLELEVVQDRFGLVNGIKSTIESEGVKFNVSENRIKQIEAKALRKLRHYSRAKNLSSININQFDRELEENQECIDKLKEEIDKYLSDRNLTLEEVELEKIKSNENIKQYETQQIEIEDLNLSPRPYNCLKRAGIICLSDIIEMDLERLKGIKNLGKRSYTEIVDKVHEMGYSIGNKDEIVDISDSEREDAMFIETFNRYKIALEKQKKLEEEKKKFDDVYKEAFQKAYDFYINEEDLWDLNQVIPAFKKLKEKEDREEETIEDKNLDDSAFEQKQSELKDKDDLIVGKNSESIEPEQELKDDSIVGNTEESEISDEGKSDEKEEKVVETKPTFEQVVSEINMLKAKREELARQIEDKKQEIASAGEIDIEGKKQELKNLVDQEKFNEISILLEQIKEIENEKSRRNELNRELQELEENLRKNGVAIEDLKNDLKNRIDEM